VEGRKHEKRIEKRTICKTKAAFGETLLAQFSAENL